MPMALPLGQLSKSELLPLRLPLLPLLLPTLLLLKPLLPLRRLLLTVSEQAPLVSEQAPLLPPLLPPPLPPPLLLLPKAPLRWLRRMGQWGSGRCRWQPGGAGGTMCCAFQS